ncbi:DUF2339 domain-containing protein [Luteimonas aquatica]|uniref:DUF2339 domain-containing protein n=1 Tax=Luteimonas aquatica TaxID=450364 RepID=UPI001F5657A6|nr:DUF2339 domain-containing protein [Luteimonas aquatica]
MESLLVFGGLVALAVPVLLVVALVSVTSLRHRVADLERQVDRLRQATRQADAPAARADERQETAVVPPPAPPAPRPASELPVAATPAAAPSTPPAPRPVPAAPAAPAAPPPLPQPPRAPAPPSVVEVALRAVRNWFTTGNLPVKIGMLVLLAGIASLLKYASDQGWLRLPIELRLTGVAAFALAGLVFGWRQRERRRSFGLALQGGAIGVLLLTVFAAFKLYALMDAGVAFALSVALVAGLGVLAVAQNTRTLAVLGILAGFLAPIWLSTGSGNHVALFSYYAVLNAAILAIAWWRPWRVLNLLGFVFTWGIGTLWGVLQYDPAKFASTQPFLLLFFAFYLLIPILYARRRPARRRDPIDGCLLFGTPLVAFVLQAGLLEGARMPLAYCALGLAALYAGLAWALIRRERFAILGQAHALLAVGFATLAVPLALSARATASVFALEGAALVWLGLKQQRRLPQFTGAGLQLAAAFALLASWDLWHTDVALFLNPTYMGALLIAVAGLVSAHGYRAAGRPQLALPYYLWGLAWWCGAAMREISQLPAAWNAEADALLALAAVTGWLAAEAHRRRPAPALALTTLAGLLAAMPLALMQTMAHAQPFAACGLWAWLAFAVLGVRSLLCLRQAGDRFAAWAQFLWWLVWPLVFSLLFGWVADRFDLAQGWALALGVLPWLAVAWGSLSRWNWLAAPLGERFAARRALLQTVYFGVLWLGWLYMLLQPASAAPLPWVPLLNASELAQLAILLLTGRWLQSPLAPHGLTLWRRHLLLGGGFAWLTMMVLRAVHHWGGTPWSPDMFSAGLVQTSLTVTWSVLGVLGWILGSRGGRRSLWLAGAVLMGVVLAKLVLIDRTHLGNLLGIGSFIAYGLLCTVVGFFAPAPPRSNSEEPVRT